MQAKSPSIATTFKVTRFPTDVIVTTQGQALSHSVSPQDPNAYVAMLSQPIAANQLASASQAQPGPTMNPLAQSSSNTLQLRQLQPVIHLSHRLKPHKQQPASACTKVAQC